MQLILGAVLAGLPLVLFELISRRYNMKPELSRKLVHVSSAIVVCLLTLLCSLNQLALIGAFFVLILLLSRKIKLWHSLYKVKRDSWGEVVFPLAVSITALLAHGNVKNFVGAILVMGLADTVAAMVGQKHSKHKLPIIKSKTLEGSLSFLATSLVVYISLFGFDSKLLVVALVVTVSEAFSGKGVDNLTVPVISVLLVRVLL